MEFESMDDFEFPKNVGIVFCENSSPNNTGSAVRLNFDQIACSHLLLQMNFVQNTFDFQIIDYFVRDDCTKNILKWFDDKITEFQNKNDKDMQAYRIDYWIGITSEKLGGGRFIENRYNDKSNSAKMIWIITSDIWEKSLSPPSLFEYIAMTIYLCSLRSLSQEFDGKLYLHMQLKTKGCLFDFTKRKQHRRITVSSPNFCFYCKWRVKNLEEKIMKTKKIDLPLLKESESILSKKWMGRIDEIDSPIYNLKKNYGYDLDRNSGFYKTNWEKFRDSIYDKTPEWIIGGLISLGFALFLAFICGAFNL